MNDPICYERNKPEQQVPEDHVCQLFHVMAKNDLADWILLQEEAHWEW